MCVSSDTILRPGERVNRSEKVFGACPGDGPRRGSTRNLRRDEQGIGKEPPPTSTDTNDKFRLNFRPQTPHVTLRMTLPRNSGEW